MKTENKIQDLFATPINQFTNEELNILFDHTFDMFVYTDPNDKNKRCIVFDINSKYGWKDSCNDRVYPIDENRFLWHYISIAKKYRVEELKECARLELQREFKKLFNL